MILRITALLPVVCLFSACASSPALPTFGDEIRKNGGVYSAIANDWDQATKDERNALKLAEEGRDRMAKGEKLIAEAKKDMRKGEDMVERGDREVREGDRDASAAKSRREQAEASYRSARGLSFPSAVTGGAE